MKRQRSHGNQGGFTLIELIIAMGIGGILLGVVTVMLLQMNRLTILHQDALRASHQLQQAASLLNRDVVGAASGAVTASADGVTLTLDILTIPTFGAVDEPITTTVTYVYSEADQTLRRTDSLGPSIISRQVTELDLGPSGPISSTLWVTMTVTSPVHEQQMTLELHRRLDATPPE